MVVVGGGAIATDACQSSIKLGAGDVYMCAIEPEAKLPAFGNGLVWASIWARWALLSGWSAVTRTNAPGD